MMTSGDNENAPAGPARPDINAADAPVTDSEAPAPDEDLATIQRHRFQLLMADAIAHLQEPGPFIP